MYPREASVIQRRAWLLGGLRLARYNQSLVLHGERAASLLAFLFLESPIPHNREKLADLLWPDAPVTRVRRNLSDLLYRLRLSLGEDWLELTPTHVALRAGGDIWVDVQQFHTWCEAGDERSLRQAVALYRGELVPEVYDEWILGPRAALRDRYLAASFQLAELSESQAQPDAAIEFFRCIVQVDPLHEPAIQGLMRLYAGQGRPAAAREVFLRFEQRLADELNTQPSHSTLALAQSLLPPPPVSLPHSGPSQEPRMYDWGILDQADSPAALRAASEELLAKDRAAEGAILCQLGSRLVDSFGRPLDALPLLRRAVERAEAENDRALHTRALCVWSSAQQSAGQNIDAYRSAALALALVEIYPYLEPLRGQTLHALAIAAWNRADYATSWVALHRAIALHRTASAHEGLATTLLDASILASWIGQHEAARHHLHDLALLTRQGEQLQEGVEATRLAHSALVQARAGFRSAAAADLEHLKEWMRTAPDGRPLFVAWVALGRLRLLEDRPTEAARAFRRAAHIWRRAMQGIEIAPFLLWAIAEQRSGDAERARTALRQAEEALRNGDARRHDVLWRYTRWVVLGDIASLEHARSEIERQALALGDREMANAFRHNVPLHQAVASSHPAPTASAGPLFVRLARLDAPLGRPLSEHELIEVVWTVDAGPEDAEMLRHVGRAGLRRHRLRRLLSEAAIQGAAPTDNDLALALGVSRRTILRDMEILSHSDAALCTRRRACKLSPSRAFFDL